MAAARHDTTPYKGHFALYVCGLTLALALLALTAWLAHKGTPTGWEYSWFRAINEWSEGWYRPMVITAFFGSTLWALIAVVGAFLLRFYRLAWRLSLSVMVGFGLAVLAKHVVGRPRPDALFADVHARINELGLGYPSAHTAIATIVLLSLVPYIGSWIWRSLLLAGIALVALSQVYLGVQLPLDVVGGVALGTAVVAFVRVMPQPLRVLLRID